MRLIQPILLIICLIGLAACGVLRQTPPPPPQPPPAANANPPEAPPPEEPPPAQQPANQLEEPAAESPDAAEPQATTEVEETAPEAAVEDAPAEDQQIEETSAAETQPVEPALLTAWLLNTTGETSPHFTDASGNPAPVNVQSVEPITIEGQDFVRVRASGIPNYSVEITQEIVDSLTGRPNAASEFAGGRPSVQVGQVVGYGDNIGYAARMGCQQGSEGYGYWPPGPACPTVQSREMILPLNPEPAAESELCETGIDEIGLWVNGTAIYNWSDAQSYNREGVWQNIAFAFEIYDLDICPGHSANGDYHHHSYPTCLGRQLNDDGSDHSPIIGFAADGYPIYGPWQAAGVLAQSCWQPRDYDDPNSPTGCGVSGERTCLLVDPTDLSQGTTPAPSPGPRTDAVVQSMSGNPIPAVSGVYFEDYYFDAACAAQGGPALDEHNGHSHDGLGYHYHAVRIQNDDGSLTDVFPYYVGPTFYGRVHEVTQQSDVRCGLGPAGGGGGPGGGGPPGGGNAEGQPPQGGAQAGAQGEPPDFSRVAEILGVSEQTLLDALGPPPPDVAAAAQKLGISEQALRQAMDAAGAPAR